MPSFTPPSKRYSKVMRSRVFNGYDLSACNSSSKGQRAARGIMRSRNTWLGACKEMARYASPDSPSSRRPFFIPQVDTVMRLGEKFKPWSSLRLCKQFSMVSKFKSGSPMPMNTRLRKTGWSGRVSPR